MPEYPEVATIIRGLRREIIDHTIEDVAVFDPRSIRPTSPEDFGRFLVGETFSGIDQHGKFLIFHFTSGKGMIVHLRMTGKFVVPGCVAGEECERRHVRIEFSLSGKASLLFQDMRLFGTFTLCRPGEWKERLAHIGPDPFSREMSGGYLAQKSLRRKCTVKVFLLNQKVISGLGNIYVCEALFAAGISPLTPAAAVSEAAYSSLLTHIVNILKLALANNGTSIRDFAAVDTKKGNFQNMLKVYGREGESCRRCQNESARILRIRQAGRSTFYCPECQR